MDMDMIAVVLVILDVVVINLALKVFTAAGFHSVISEILAVLSGIVWLHYTARWVVRRIENV